jgi:hypothetical protein
VLERFADALSCIDQCFIADEMLKHLPVASQVGKTIVGGIDLNKARIRHVVEALIALCPPYPTALSPPMSPLECARSANKANQSMAPDNRLRSEETSWQTNRPPDRPYPSLRAAPDRFEGDDRALLVLRNKAIKPLLAAAQPLRPTRGAHHPKPIDAHYHAIRSAMKPSSLPTDRPPERDALPSSIGTTGSRSNVRLGQFGRNRSNVWHYPGANSFARCGEEGNLSALHPTVKPVAMIADAILDCSARGDIVLDGFLGSGTTVIAAERTGRRCYGIEL